MTTYYVDIDATLTVDANTPAEAEAKVSNLLNIVREAIRVRDDLDALDAYVSAQ